MSGSLQQRMGQAQGAARALLSLAGRPTTVPGALVLAYHDVGDDPANTTDYYVSPSRLRQQLRWTTELGMSFVSLAELSRRWRAGDDIDGLASVVFDDSLVGVHHHAMPVLLDLEVPATVFTVTDALGSSPAWWSGAARVMTRDEAGEMAANGFDLASHTRSHPSLTSLDRARLGDEVVGSRHEIEDLMGRLVPVFAYPYGHHDAAVRQAVGDAGYETSFTFLNGRVTPGLDPFKLPRLNMWQGQDKARLAYHLGRPASSWPPHQQNEIGHLA